MKKHKPVKFVQIAVCMALSLGGRYESLYALDDRGIIWTRFIPEKEGSVWQKIPNPYETEKE